MLYLVATSVSGTRIKTRMDAMKSTERALPVQRAHIPQAERKGVFVERILKIGR